MTKRVFKRKSFKKTENAAIASVASPVGADELFYQVKPWKIGIRVFGVVLIATLSVALCFSTLTAKHFVVNSYWLKQMLLFLLLILLNTSILLSIFIEVWQVRASATGLQLRTLLWRSNLTWQDIVWFRHPGYLKIAMLKTKRCFYLFNKQDLIGYPALEQFISAYIKEAK